MPTSLLSTLEEATTLCTLGAVAFELLLTGIGVVAGGIGLWFWRSRSQEGARQEALRIEKAQKLHRFLLGEASLFTRLDSKAQARFVGRALDFLDEQRMFYVDTTRYPDPVPLDQEDETLAWRIAASAATLSLGVETLQWPKERDILVYPTAFDDNYETGANHNIAGMVHAQGPIIFSATDLKRSYQKEDGYNVGLHELAHVLDLADSYADGSITGVKAVQGKAWSTMVNERILAIRSGRYGKVNKTLRDYAGTNEAEFFAVAVEAFFEEPETLRDADAGLFERLVQTFRFDPATLTRVGAD